MHAELLRSELTTRGDVGPRRHASVLPPVSHVNHRAVVAPPPRASRFHHYAILLVAGACGSPQSADPSSSPRESERPAAIAPRIDDVPIARPEPADAGADAGSVVAAPVDVDQCAGVPVPPAFQVDRNGSRPALPKLPVEDCAGVDLDGKAPCEVACTVVAPAPDYSTDERSPNFHMLGHTIYFTAKPAKEIGRVVTYDGPLDAISPKHLASRSKHTFVDHSTSPPTLELRAGTCMYDCAGGMPVRISGTGKSDAECRAICTPVERYRYDGKRLTRLP